MSRANTHCVVCREPLGPARAAKGAITHADKCWQDLIIWRAIDRGPRVKEIMR
jgi:hypothetical protein